mmetsp:Transcript_38279/g.36634  ORF Transcript_38279/g.36634 Transcript_38279/m.36634 type:complete len:99 (-) Transcript_38279:47-343(-)
MVKVPQRSSKYIVTALLFAYFLFLDSIYSLSLAAPIGSFLVGLLLGPCILTRTQIMLSNVGKSAEMVEVNRFEVSLKASAYIILFLYFTLTFLMFLSL